MPAAFDPARRALLTGRRPPPVQTAPTVAGAVIGAGCLTARGVACWNCAEACGEGAIRLTPTLGGPSRPSIDSERCTGCGECVVPCPVSSSGVEL